VSALNILDELDSYAALEVETGDCAPPIVFSVATERPTYELWVHYLVANEYHMFCLQYWRTTLPDHASMLIGSLGRIMEYGATDFKEDVAQKVNALWRIVCTTVMEVGV
jgi:hypothetical protein